MNHHVGILGTGSYVPEQVLTNADLEKMVDTSDEWIVTRTGIRERRIAAPEQAASDLAYEAAQKALQAAGIQGEDVDLIIVATITPDTFFPSTANILQDRLGARHAAAFDLAAACSGFLYGVVTASQFVRTGAYRYALVIGVDTLSKITNYEDRNTCVLFGDGAGAAVIGPVPEGYGLLSFELGSDGSGAPYLKLPAGGSRMPASVETVEKKLHTIHMSGQDVFKFAVRIMETASLNVIQKVGLTPADIDFFVPHQANYRIIEAAMRRLQLDESRVMVNLDRYGNMSAASIPVALDEALQQGRIKDGDRLVLVGFGGGLTWGAAVIRWYGGDKRS